ncbi:guanine nucleotide binding protein, alpha subunit [Infundibulicybe gibba]|nr:guanine nucleotide binding protein, alpha subunit [Infundibulicybe gibba]
MGGFEPDPLAHVTLPPPGETPDQKAARERREVDAQRVSDRIDEEIKLERAAMRKRRGVVKLLLLGQSESGKCAFMSFDEYARTAWKKERASWRSVIQLNLIRSIITIVETLQAEMDHRPFSPSSPSPMPQNYPYLNASASTSSSSSLDVTDSLALSARKPHGVTPLLTDKHQLLKLQDLKRRLGAGAEEVVLPEGMDSQPPSPTTLGAGRRGEFGNTERLYASSAGHGDGDEDWDDATDVIASCREDMMALWMDEAVRAVLKIRGMRLEDSAGFFLNDLERIATRNYEPSDDDVVRARLRTFAVQEHKIRFENESSLLNSIGLAHDFGKEWTIYDVGGARTMTCMATYFDDVNAIIFPISCFDERLLEDPRVNRLEDSLLLWRAVCSSKLLSQATMILFLNKCDLLKRKLKAGVRVRDHLPSYGDRSNEAAVVIKYLKEKFKDILKHCSPEPRVSYFYATSVTDTKATATTLKTVRDSILREHLKHADFV